MPLMWTNPLASVQKFPLTDSPPPHRSCPTILCIQCCSAKEGSLTAAMILSDGCFDVQKFLQCQVAARECSLWRTSTALNLTHGVGESLTVGKKACAVATGIKKTGAKMCSWPQRV
jgi:hypothetical protein